MPMVSVLDMAGKQVSEIQLNDAIFGIEPNKSALHIMVRSYLANQRQGTQSTLTRAEVSGGGRKPWKQKGTGHARQGYPFPAVDTRRYRARPEAARVRHQRKQEGKEAGYAVRSFQQGA